MISQEQVEQLWQAIEADPSTEVTVDLGTKTITAGDFRAEFAIDDYTQWRLMEGGLDDIGLTLRHEADIAAFEAGRPSFKPVTTA